MRRPGVLVAEWIVISLTALFCFLVYASEFGRSELSNLASTVLLGISLASVVPLLIGLSAINALWRSKKVLAERDSTDILTFVKSGSLAEDITSFCRAMERRAVEVPFHGSVVASREGVEVWGGSALSPKHVLTIPSSDLKKISIVRGSIGLQSGLFLSLESRVEEVRLSFQLVGGGPLGLFAPKTVVVTRIADAWASRTSNAG